MRFATGTTVKDYRWYHEWLRVAEDAGFSMLTTGDSQSLWADPFVTMAVAAERTTAPRIGVTVSNPMTRHPGTLAARHNVAAPEPQPPFPRAPPERPVRPLRSAASAARAPAPDRRCRSSPRSACSAR